jgi:hypothetical protein
MIVKYELIYNLHQGFKVFLAELESNYSPAVGSIVNINGDPFVVYTIEAAVFQVSKDDQNTYLYVSVFKAGSFELEIGGKEY